MVYGCDAAWWKYRRGLPEYQGTKVTWAGNGLNEFPDIQKVEIGKNGTGGYTDRMLFDRPGEEIGGGGNSGFQALNLAVQFGARRVLLVGYDMTDRSGVHWYGRNRWPMSNNPNESNFRRWLAAFEGAKPLLDARGVEVVNTSSISAMKTFRRRSIEDALKEWA